MDFRCDIINFSSENFKVFRKMIINLMITKIIFMQFYNLQEEPELKELLDVVEIDSFCKITRLFSA
jgi:hypothetical protein